MVSRNGSDYVYFVFFILRTRQLFCWCIVCSLNQQSIKAIKEGFWFHNCFFIHHTCYICVCNFEYCFFGACLLIYLHQILFHFSELLFRFSELIFCFSEFIFRFSELLFRFSELLFRFSQLLFGFFEILFWCFSTYYFVIFSLDIDSNFGCKMLLHTIKWLPNC